MSGLPSSEVEDVALQSVENLVKSGHIDEAHIVGGYASENKVIGHVVNGAAHLISKGRIKDIEDAAKAFSKFEIPRFGIEGFDALSVGLLELARNTHINHESKMHMTVFAFKTFQTRDNERKMISLDIVEYFINAGTIGSASTAVHKLGITRNDLVQRLEKMKQKGSSNMLRKD